MTEPRAETIGRLARERNLAQNAARHAADALAELGVAAEALRGAPDPEAGQAAGDAATASAALARLVDTARHLEKTAQERFWTAWDAFRAQNAELTPTAAGQETEVPRD